MKTDITWKRIVLYVGITFAATYLIEILVIGTMMKDSAMLPYIRTVTSCIMFIPAFGSLITRGLTNEGLKDFYVRADLKDKKIYYILAWFGPSVLILFGAAVYFLIFPTHFDANMSYMMEGFKQSGTVVTLEQLRSSFISQLCMAVVLGPVLNVLYAFGEELGWRGYLLPKLSSKLKILPTLLISGVIWGLWHAPLIAITGHNYGFGYAGYPITGILAMCVFCIMFGTFLSYVTIKTKSCLASTFAHGALNAVSSISIFFMAYGATPNPFVGPLPVGIIGGIGFIIVAIVLAVLLMKEESVRSTSKAQ